MWSCSALADLILWSVTWLDFAAGFSAGLLFAGFFVGFRRAGELRKARSTNSGL